MAILNAVQGYPIALDAGVTIPPEVDIRFYDFTGKRLNISQDWVDTLQFEIAERGGMQTGSLQMLVPWEQLQLFGNERVDIRLWGQLVYRGYVRQPQNELAAPAERASPTLHGLMELLNGYLVRRDFGYAPAVSPSVVFGDLAALYVTTSSRMPALVLDTTGVDALGLTTWGVTAKGKSVPQALNALCDLFPDQIIWGCDVDGSGANRLYLRPRATSVGYKFAVGDKVGAFVYPRDCTKIVNRIFITGGRLDGSNGTNPNNANLLPNASFETGAQNNEIDGNLLQNGDFEEIDSFGTVDAWNLSGASLATGVGRAGNGIALNSGGNLLYQDIAIGSVPASIHAACWWGAAVGVSWSTKIKFELYDASSTLVASSYQAAQTQPVDAVGNTFLHLTYDWTPTPGLSAVKLRVIYNLVSTSGATVLDDASCWVDGAEQAASWRAGQSSLGGFSALDWRNRDLTPYHGDVMLKAVVNVGSGGWGEISTRHKDRPKGSPNRAYLLSFWVYTPVGSSVLHCAVGARIVQSDTLKATIVAGAQTTTPGAWTQIVSYFHTGANCDAVEPFLRMLDSGTYYVDAAGMWVDVTAAPDYAESDTYQAVRSVTDFSSVQIGVEALASITTWGEREADVTNGDIVTSADADAYAQSYFKETAVPAIQARLTIKGATAPIGLDGQVKLLNLPAAPDALTPVRLRYQIGSSIDIEADLSNERPQLENLLRLVAAGKV